MIYHDFNDFSRNDLGFLYGFVSIIFFVYRRLHSSIQKIFVTFKYGNFFLKWFKTSFLRDARITFEKNMYFYIKKINF